jgi:hypothetical protein
MKRLLIIFLIVLSPSILISQERTVGLIEKADGIYPGYTLFAPLNSETVYLIDNDGNLIHQWVGEYEPGHAVYLLENGNLLKTCVLNNPTFKTGGSGGMIRIYDWNGDVQWEYIYSSDNYCQHHDCIMLPNGNVIFQAWERKSKKDALSAGRKATLMRDDYIWVDHIVEVKPTGKNTGEIVWEWHLWDHLIQEEDKFKQNYGVVSEHPELVNINYTQSGPQSSAADWNHTNSICYNEKLDQLLVSVRNLDEIWVIDHSTSTAEASSHSGGKYGKGGDLLYRWGNPQSYSRGTPSDQQLFKQHNAVWINEGLPGEDNILVFNNGTGREDGDYTTVEEITVPIDNDGNYLISNDMPFGPESSVWRYISPNKTDFYAMNISGSQRLPNGNTLICNGPYGEFFEVNSNGDILWKYINPVVDGGILFQFDDVPSGQLGQTNTVFRAERYALDHPAFIGKDLTPKAPIEKYHTNVKDHVGNNSMITVFPNPSYDVIIIKIPVHVNEKIKIEVIDIYGDIIYSGYEEAIEEPSTISINISELDIQTGCYQIKLKSSKGIWNSRFVYLQ